MANEGLLYQIVIHTTPEKVWQALTTAEFTRQYWFGRSVESDWQVGSDVKITTPEGVVEVRGKLLEAVPNKRLSYTWGSGNPGTDDTTVTFEIIQMGPLVKLVITQDIDLASSGAQQAVNGWTFILCGLKTVLETGVPMPAIPWRK